MHSTMRAYDSLVLETTQSCTGRIAQRSCGGGSDNGLTQAGLTSSCHAVQDLTACDISPLANEIVSASAIESVVDI